MAPDDKAGGYPGPGLSVEAPHLAPAMQPWQLRPHGEEQLCPSRPILAPRGKSHWVRRVREAAVTCRMCESDPARMLKNSASLQPAKAQLPRGCAQNSEQVPVPPWDVVNMGS